MKTIDNQLIVNHLKMYDIKILSFHASYITTCTYEQTKPVTIH